MRVFITGATGLVGSHLARELRTRGHEVVAMHRKDSDVRLLREMGCELAPGDVRDEAEALLPAVKGCSHLVHAAGLVYAGGSWPKVRAVNVDGTRHVLTAARLAGVGHVIHVSSVAVYGTVEGPTDERSPTDSPLPPTDLYARSKREAEEVAHGIRERRGLPVSVLRLAAVYGERDRLMVPALVGILRLPLVPLLGPGTNSLPVVYAGNVAGALACALAAPRAGQTYDVAMDHPVSQRDLFEGLGSGMGMKPRLVKLPEKLVRGGSEVLARFGVGTPGAEHLPLTRVVKLALAENPFQSTRARDELGWKPAYEHRPALERTGRWYLESRANRTGRA
jgi:nucleoside-diphosphate-sugar epimerase